MIPQETPRTYFEQRMRLRRAATCVSAARVALEAGRLAEAQERLEEARRLDPDGLEAQILLEQIRSFDPEVELEPMFPDEAEPQGARRWSHWAAVVVAVIALAVLAWWRTPAPDETRATPARQPERARPQVEVPRAVDADPLLLPPAFAEAFRPGEDEGGELVARAEPRPAPSRGEEPPALGTTGAEEIPAAPADGRRAAMPARRGAASAGASENAPAAVRGGEPTPTEARADRPPVAAARPVVEPDAPAAVAPPPAPAAAAGEEPATSLPAPTMLATPVPLDTPAETRAIEADAARASLRDPAAEEQAIGEVLGQYADAYNRLDARAASRVWPSVDERALARAFANLESQGVTFERCDLDVQGGEATAACLGRASYVPKIGNRDVITMTREWSFQLRRVGPAWRILKAEAR